MDLQQCWTNYLKAEQLLEQGHWPEAHNLYDQVLSHLPSHIHNAINDEHTKPCQFGCLLRSLRDSAISQSEILNKMGQYQNAFDLLNQSYGLLQFISIEPTELIEATHSMLDRSCNDLLSHMGAFCSAQRNAQWMLEFEHVQKAHHHFATLKGYGNALGRSH